MDINTVNDIMSANSEIVDLKNSLIEENAAFDSLSDHIDETNRLVGMNEARRQIVKEKMAKLAHRL